jgi:hypothetical protein
MKTLVNRIVVVAASALVLGTMAYGQTEMKATIPFPFRTAISSLPAGEYTVGQYNTNTGLHIATLQGQVSRHKVFVPAGVTDYVKAGSPSLLFRCTDDGGCVLAEIRTRDRATTYAGGKNARDKEAALITIRLRPVNAD